MIPSKNQLDVYKFIETGLGNCVISSVAGSGKTTTLIEAVRKIPLRKSKLFLAFNKSIVEELKSRISFGVTVRTFHSLGNGYITTTFPDMKFNNYKFYNYSEKLLEPYVKSNYPKKQHSAVISEYKEFVNILRNNAIIIPEGLTDRKIDKILEQIYAIENNNFDFEYIGTNDDFIRGIKLLREMNADRKVFDFNDMIYLPIANKEIGLNITPYDYVLVDECQDLNITQQLLLDNLVKANTGRFIAVGDERQAIYGFAGADVYSFKNLTRKINTTILPLSVCYRSGKKQIKYAQRFVPQIEPYENAIDGIIRDGDVNEAVDGDMVLSRINRNLITQFFTFIKDKKKCFIKGKDIGENLIRFIIKSEAKDLIQFDKYTKIELEKIKIKLEIKIGFLLNNETFMESSEYEKFHEKVECIKVLYDHYKNEISDFQALPDKINNIFKDDGEGIILSTAHKAKGLENNRVFILDAHIFPIKYAEKDWEKIQEQNLYYVAITRSKKELVFVNESFERRIFRYLLFKEYNLIRELFKETNLNKKKKDLLELEAYYFLEDVDNYVFDFSSSDKKRIYSYFKNKGFLSLEELEAKQKNIINEQQSLSNKHT